jgi:hypothetical protein
MKQHIKIPIWSFLFLITLIVMSLGCIKRDKTPPTDPSGHLEFLALMKNAEDKIGSGSRLAIVRVKDMEAEIEQLADIYPRVTSKNSILPYIDMMDDQIAVALHNDFRSLDPAPAGSHNHSWRGAVVHIPSKSWKKLPLLPANRPNNEYTTIESTPTLCENGEVAYISGWNDRSYGDTWDHRAVKYSPASENFISAPSPVLFATLQPEATSSTGNAWVDGGPSFLSPDGRYFYTHIWGGWYSGWNFIKQFSYLARYDFQSGNFERVGDLNDKGSEIRGWTRDKKHIVYHTSAGGPFRTLNVETGEKRQLTWTPNVPKDQRLKWNDYGYLIESGVKIDYIDVVNDTHTAISAPGTVSSAHFGREGAHIYFTVTSSGERYLCRTKDLTANAEIDTLFFIPQDIADMIILQ